MHPEPQAVNQSQQWSAIMVDEPNVPRAMPVRQNAATTSNLDAAKENEQRERERRERVQKDDDERRKRQEENNKQAAEVMEKSTPWPTQEVADKAKLGLIGPDDVEAPDQPEMPPLHEQRRDERQQRRDERKR
jgi:hypothetical protein